MTVTLTEFKQDLARRIASILDDDDFVLGLGEHDDIFARYSEDLVAYVNDNLTDKQRGDLVDLGYTIEDFVSDSLVGMIYQTFPDLTSHYDDVTEAMFDELEDPELHVLHDEYYDDVAGYLTDYVTMDDVEQAVVKLVLDGVIATDVDHNFEIDDYIDAIR